MLACNLDGVSASALNDPVVSACAAFSAGVPTVRIRGQHWEILASPVAHSRHIDRQGKQRSDCGNTPANDRPLIGSNFTRCWRDGASLKKRKRNLIRVQVPGAFCSSASRPSVEPDAQAWPCKDTGDARLLDHCPQLAIFGVFIFAGFGFGRVRLGNQRSTGPGFEVSRIRFEAWSTLIGFRRSGRRPQVQLFRSNATRTSLNLKAIFLRWCHGSNSYSEG